MSTIIRDINGNRTTRTLRHLSNNMDGVGYYHTDSTGLFVCVYVAADGVAYQAMIRPESQAERNAIRVARRLGSERPL